MEDAFFSWGHAKPWNDYSSFIKQKYTERVQKISIDAGFTCPNRDGTKGRGGCTYCNNNTFNPFYCSPKKIIRQQLNEGIDFFSKKYKAQRYLAYFQAYSNTYAELSLLKKWYEEALAHPQVIGLVIATRPDVVNADILDYLSFLAEKYTIILEYGIESTLDSTLERINRGHTFNETKQAFHLSANRGILLGGHLILGLPGESREQILAHASEISKLPLQTLKLHQLQIIKDTLLAKQYEKKSDFVHLFSINEYIELVIDFLELLNPSIILERFISESPLDLLIAPRWEGLKNFAIVAKIEKRMKERNTWQGKYYVTAN